MPILLWSAHDQVHCTVVACMRLEFKCHSKDRYVIGKVQPHLVPQPLFLQIQLRACLQECRPCLPDGRNLPLATPILLLACCSMSKCSMRILVVCTSTCGAHSCMGMSCTPFGERQVCYSNYGKMHAKPGIAQVCVEESAGLPCPIGLHWRWQGTSILRYKHSSLSKRHSNELGALVNAC